MDEQTILNRNNQSLCDSDAGIAAGWFLFRTPDGSTVIAPGLEAAQNIAPPRRLGWEGYGARFQDGVEPEAALAAVIKDAADLIRSEENGACLSAAIGALHGQRRPDGRPMVYLPEDS